MNETGIILKIENDRVLLCVDEIVQEQGGCSGSCASCGHKSIKKRNIWVKYGNNKDLHESDQVEVYYPPLKILVTIFTLIISPLILFFLFYYYLPLFFKIQNTFFSALSGIVGITAGLLIHYLIFKINKNYQLPEITKKIIE